MRFPQTIGTLRLRDVKKEPIYVRLLGQDLVLFRSQGRISALQGKCPSVNLPGGVTYVQ